MVRAGVVGDPSEWAFSGYREIQEPRRKCALIAYERLRELAGFATYDQFQASHRGWVDESRGDGGGRCDRKWTRSIAVGSEQFVERTKVELDIRAKGRKAVEDGKAYRGEMGSPIKGGIEV